MSDTLARTIENITKTLSSMIREKKTGKVSYEINVSQGGIRDAKIRVEHDLMKEE